MQAVDAVQVSEPTFRDIRDEIAEFESCDKVTNKTTDEPLYRFPCFIEERMPVIYPRKGDLGLRNFRDESIRRLAISFLKDCTELPSLIRKIKEIHAPH